MTKLEEFQRWPGAASPSGHGRRILAGLLRQASAALARLAALLAMEQAPARRNQVLEYHAEAGAPEGALYVDGQLVGWITGVRRL